MSEAGLWELIIIFVLALLILGPERLPVVARKVGYWIGKTRRFVNSVKSDVEKEFRSEELERMLMEQSKEIQNLRTIVSETRSEAVQSINEAESQLAKVAEDTAETAKAIEAPTEAPATTTDKKSEDTSKP